jgi:hypothetical protein
VASTTIDNPISVRPNRVFRGHISELDAIRAFAITMVIVASIIASKLHIEDGVQIMAGAVTFAESELPNFVAGRQPCFH